MCCLPSPPIYVLGGGTRRGGGDIWNMETGLIGSGKRPAESLAVFPLLCLTFLSLSSPFLLFTADFPLAISDYSFHIYHRPVLCMAPISRLSCLFWCFFIITSLSIFPKNIPHILTLLFIPWHLFIYYRCNTFPDTLCPIRLSRLPLLVFT
jgi:hypothetical protein